MQGGGWNGPSPSDDPDLAGPERLSRGLAGIFFGIGGSYYNLETIVERRKRIGK